MERGDKVLSPSSINNMKAPMAPPPLVNTKGNHRPSMEGSSGYSSVSMATRDVWDRLFDRGYRADVCVNTNNGGVIRVHSIVLVSSFFLFFYVL